VYDNYLPWQQLHIIPVIHNLECFQVPSMIDALEGIRCCTVSLRHESALSSLKDLAEQFGPYCDVGVSTVVSTDQVQYLMSL
jgi:2-keto-3-deoxy-6-phosphogluconate aldolase